MSYFDNGREVVDVGPYKVEKDVLEIIQRLYDYDPNLEVMMLDPNKADFCDAPYIIAERCKDGMLRRIFEVWELNETVLDRVRQADMTKYDIQARMDKIAAQVKRDRERRYQEERDEAKDVFKHILASPKGNYTFPNSRGETVRLDDMLGITHRDGKRVQ